VSEPKVELDELVIQFIAHEIKARDFHSGDLLHLDWHYRSEAEDKINRMKNTELLDTLGRALRWYRDGGDIGL
jgi:hypothetical protein